MENSALSGKKHLIFDFDETLFTLHLPWGEYLDHTYKMLRKYNPDFYARHKLGAGSNYELINLYTEEFGREIRDQALEYGCKFEKENLTGVTRHDEYADFVLQNQGKYHIYIWSSNCVSTIEQVLEEYGLINIFEKIIGRDSVVYTKPNPEGFELITSEMENPDKAEFLMIGDSGSDEAAAAAAGIGFYFADNS